MAKKIKEEEKFTCFQASNLLKLTERNRGVAVKMFKDQINTKNQWNKIFIEKGLI